MLVPTLSLPPFFSAPKRRRSDGSRRHTGTAGLIWLISVRTTSNQAPHPDSLTPVSPWDTSIYTLTQCCNSPKCLHQTNHWSSGRLWFRVMRAAQHIDSHEKNHMINVVWWSVASCSSTRWCVTPTATNNLVIATSSSLYHKCHFKAASLLWSGKAYVTNVCDFFFHI